MEQQARQQPSDSELSVKQGNCINIKHTNTDLNRVTVINNQIFTCVGSISHVIANTYISFHFHHLQGTKKSELASSMKRTYGP